KGGQWSQVTHYSPDFHVLRWNPPKLLQPVDIKAFLLLSHDGGFNGFELKDEAGRVALEHMLQSQRLLLSARVVRRGPPETVEWQWRDSDNRHQLQAQLKGREQWRLLETIPPCYLYLETADIGDLITPLNNPQLVHLLRMPAVPAARMRDVALKLRQVLSEDQLTL